MTALREYVSQLSEEECRAIHADSCELETKGKIGDGALRYHANKFLRESGIGQDEPTVLWMLQISTEVWRRFAICALEAQEAE